MMCDEQTTYQDGTHDSVRQPLIEMARDAARRLIARIEGSDESQPSRVEFPTHLVQRATTGRAP